MTTLLRRRDEHDGTNDVSADVEANVSGVISPDSTFEEPGSKIWGPYLNLADKYDKDLVHNWRDDMDSLLIFAALFSASVTAFVIESYKTLVQDSGDVTVHVLLHISQQLANGTQLPSAVHPTFQPAPTDIAINIFWFLSLGFSLACALAAVLVRQWARQYLRLPRNLSTTTERARSRQFLLENMEWWKMELIVETIPALLHISLILFFIGLLLFVHSISVTLAVYFLCFSAISGSAYAILTMAPIAFPGCPYKTPFSGVFQVFLRCGASLIRATWKYTTITFACFAFLLTSTLSLLKMWLPSATIPEWSRAMESSEPIRSPFRRVLRQMREMAHQIWSIRMTSRHLIPILIHTPRTVHAFTTSAWSSVISSVRNASLSASESLMRRRQSFQNQLSMRDAHALQWAMKFSKRDIDFFTIISSVPELVEMHKSDPVVRLVLWKSGTMLQSLRLLRSTAISGRYVASQPVLVACLESIIWITQCPTWRLDEDSAWLATETALMDELIEGGIAAMQHVRMPDDVTPILDGVFTNLFFHRIYSLETWIRSLDFVNFQQECHPWRSSIDRLFRLFLSYRRASSRFMWHRRVEDWPGFPLLAVRRTSSQLAVCRSLSELRAAWAAVVIRNPSHSLGSPPPFHSTILNHHCDVATHLQRAPLSSRNSQAGVFMLVDALFVQDAIETLTKPKQSALQSAYSLVLFGHDDKHSMGPLRRLLHARFLSHVHVFPGGGIPFDKSAKTVEIPFSGYCDILNDIVLSLVTLEVDPTIETREEFWSHYGDIQASAIRAIIGTRLRGASEYHAIPVVVGAQHLTAVRAIRTIRTVVRAIRSDEVDWADIIDRTAHEFGYAFQLEESYSIDMHAELQYYEQDQWT